MEESQTEKDAKGTYGVWVTVVIIILFAIVVIAGAAGSDGWDRAFTIYGGLLGGLATMAAALIAYAGMHSQILAMKRQTDDASLAEENRMKDAAWTAGQAAIERAWDFVQPLRLATTLALQLYSTGEHTDAFARLTEAERIAGEFWKEVPLIRQRLMPYSFRHIHPVSHNIRQLGALAEKIYDEIYRVKMNYEVDMNFEFLRSLDDGLEKYYMAAATAVRDLEVTLPHATSKADQP